ncbi:hypothetical protein DSECCO2_552200 [anaerobic digester metagenome]
MGRGELVVGRVAGEGGDVRDAAFFEDAVDLEPVAADVVLAQEVDLELAGLLGIVLAHDLAEDLVVGDVVAGRLADALVAFAAEGEDVAVPELGLHLAGHGVDVVADEAHGTGRENRDGPGVEEVVGFLDGRLQLLLAAEDDVLVLHVRGKAVGHEVLVALARRVGLVSAGQPGVEAAADGAVGDVDDVAGGPEDDALAAGVGAAAHGDDAGDGAHIGRYFRRLVAEGLVDEDLGGALPGHLGRIFGEHFRLHVRGRPVDELFRSRCHGFLLICPDFSRNRVYSMDLAPFSPVLTRTASIMGRTKILPSPGWPVLLVSVMTLTTSGTRSSVTTTVSMRLG